MRLRRTPRSPTSARPGLETAATVELALVAAVLSYGATSQRHAQAHWQLPTNLAAAGAAVAIARAGGASWGELGLDPGAVPSGLRLGAVTVLPACAAVGLALATPPTRRLFTDERVTGATGKEVARDALVRIPLATATAEELLFRSAVLGLALHRHSRARAFVTTSLAFGLWHVLPALRSYEANPAGARLADRAGGRPAAIAATVAVTTVAGAGLAWLRLRSRSVVAPILVHGGLNVAGLLAAWASPRLGRRSAG